LQVKNIIKRTALACVALCGAPAAALAQNVTIYGTLNADYESVEIKGASGPNFGARSRVTSNSSNIGFRASEDLGDGLRAFAQVESSVNFDNGTSAGFWGSRNSGIGLGSNGYGQILLGQWDSPYKSSTLRFDPFSDTGIAGYSGIMGGTGSITAGQGGSTFAERASFSRRVQNVVQYWTPDWKGLSARFAYGAPDTNVGSSSTGVSEASGLRPALYSIAVSYAAGPLNATAAYEQHKNFQPLNTLLAVPVSAGRDQAWKAGVQYGFFENALTVGAIYEQLRYKADDINGVGALERKVDNWYGALKYASGAHALAVSYGYKGKEKLSGAGFSELPDSKARQISARYGYSFSKRTQVYALATRISNDGNAFQEFGNSPITSTLLFRDPSRGGDSTGVGAGIIHSF
jgi:predicted porin